MKTILLSLLLTSFSLGLQNDNYKKEIEAFQHELNEEFKNPATSPLDAKQIKKFKGHDFFEINKKYCIRAKFTRTMDTAPFKMKTTTSRAPIYEKYGEAAFNLNGQEYKLSIYQSHRLRETVEYKNYLFLPFYDLSNGEETYGGGRYIDLSIPETDSITVDFNKAYNPYCAYSASRSCPIPPKENFLNAKIEAGVKKPK
jgi:uncharacterized protein (DUF1684 family)